MLGNAEPGNLRETDKLAQDNPRPLGACENIAERSDFQWGGSLWPPAGE